jgi:hypothetical protein
LECGICWAKEITKVCVLFFYWRVGAILGANANPLGQEVFAQSATVQVSEAFGAITVATDGSRDIGQIAATVPANYSAHEFNRSKYWAAKTELALRNESLPAAYAVNDDCKVTITVC